MKELIGEKYRWDSMNKDIDDYTKHCVICEKAGAIKQNTKNRVIETKEVGELWECDLIGRIPEKGRSTFIFTAVDHFSKWVEARAITNKRGDVIAKCIEELIIKKHGPPRIIATDNGKEFRNKECKELKEKYGFTWRFSSPYHHQGVGAIERANQTLWRKLKKLCEFGKKSWKRYVDKAVTATNISPHRAIGTSPWKLLKGKTFILDSDKIYGIEPEELEKDTLRENRATIQESYRKEIIKGKKTVKYNLNIGDQVMIFRENLSNKMKENWKPGYTIKSLVYPDAYIVIDGKNNIN